MISDSKTIALLDACVLYPAPVRDLLLSVADEGLYSPNLDKPQKTKDKKQNSNNSEI